MVPCTQLFEAEIEIFQLLSYKPILSKGYQFILHIHTVAEEAIIKEILTSYETNAKGEVIEKQKPQFALSFMRIICRIETRIPICIEKHETIEQMGRFTLRDEGMTLGSGKVLKYKPIKVATMPDPTLTSTEETKKHESGEGGGGQPKEEKKVSEMVYDMDSGEMVTKEEFDRREKERQLDQVDEDEEDYDEEEEGEKKA